MLLYATATTPPAMWNLGTDPPTAVDWVAYAMISVLVGGGTYAAYRANGGHTGADFASRYFALGWVLSIRLAIMLFVPIMLLVFGVGLAVVGPSPDDTPVSCAFAWAGAGTGIVFQAVFFWRLTYHMRQVAGAAGDDLRVERRFPA